MGFVINNNLAANNSYRSLNATQNDLSKSLEKLSTGLRINRAGDDAAGLTISEGLKAQVTGSAQAARNAQDGISVIQTAEGALTEVHSILQRVRDLSVQAANDSNNADARTAIGKEVTALGDELERMSTATNFNGISLLSGATSGNGAGEMVFQVGAGTSTADNQITVSTSSAGMDVATIATAVKGLDFTDAGTAAAAIGTVDTNIAAVSSSRADLGAAQNRLEHTIKSLNVAGENLSAAQSRIADVDMAQEMVKFTKANILSQAGTAMLAQANQSSQGVLSLLR